MQRATSDCVANLFFEISERGQVLIPDLPLASKKMLTMKIIFCRVIQDQVQMWGFVTCVISLCTTNGPEEVLPFVELLLFKPVESSISDPMANQTPAVDRCASGFCFCREKFDS